MNPLAISVINEANKKINLAIKEYAEKKGITWEEAESRMRLVINGRECVSVDATDVMINSSFKKEGETNE